MLRYVLDAFVISEQPFVSSGMHPQIAIALINMQYFWVFVMDILCSHFGTIVLSNNKGKKKPEFAYE